MSKNPSSLFMDAEVTGTVRGLEILPSVFPKAGTQSGVSKGWKTCYRFPEVWEFMDDNFSEDVIYMRMALREAERAAEAGEVPCGAIIVKDGAIIGKAHNQTELLKDPTAHAEILAITQAAAALENWRLTDAVMYVTKEPCPMCAGAIVLARLKKVVWGVDDPKRGGARSKFEILDHADLNHRVEIQTGVMEAECKGLIQGFFRERRKENKANEAE